MEHQHKYDATGKQLCCTLDNKINHESEKHSDNDGQNSKNSHKNTNTFKMFIPAIISFVLLLVGIGFDNYFHNNGLQVGFGLGCIF